MPVFPQLAFPVYRPRTCLIFAGAACVVHYFFYFFFITPWDLKKIKEREKAKRKIVRTIIKVKKDYTNT